MKVIKKGINTEGLTQQETCYKCLCVFKYALSDVKPDQRDGDYVECPSCKSFINAGALHDKIKKMRNEHISNHK